MAANHEIKLLEKCRVEPPPDAVPELILPLTFHDLPYFDQAPRNHVHFYRFHHPCPTSHHSIIQSLKSSLSLVLKHFLPLAGNMIYPIDSGDRLPELRYMKGDSVSVTIAESKDDFDYLVGDHQRDSYKFNPLLPHLPEPFVSSGFQISPLLALQITFFPMYGVSIGHTFLHVVGDASTFINFCKSWSSINKFNGISLELLPTFSQPLYDRSVVQDPFNLKQKIFNDIILLKYLSTPRIQNPTSFKDYVRATFVIHRSDIMKLKSLISHNVSAYTVTCALIWTCLSKSLDDVTVDKVEEDNLERIRILINCRERFDSMIPQNYFGNCIVPCVVGLTHGKLIGNEGFVVAATSIGDAIKKMLNDNEGILRGDWLPHLHTLSSTGVSETLSISGSAQYNVFNFNEDFGWGELVKHEYISAYSSRIFMLTTLSRRFKGAFELGISLPKKRMDAFTINFKDYINNLSMKSTNSGK